MDYADYGLSHEARAAIEEETRRMLEEAYARAAKRLKKHEKTLHTLAEELLVKETMTGVELRKFVGAPARGGRRVPGRGRREGERTRGGCEKSIRWKNRRGRAGRKETRANHRRRRREARRRRRRRRRRRPRRPRREQPPREPREAKEADFERDGFRARQTRVRIRSL